MYSLICLPAMISWVTMMGVLRKLWGALMQVWVCVVSTISWMLRRTRKDHTHSDTSPSQWKAGPGEGDTEWDSWDSVENFSVKVVPDGSHGDKEEDEDLFKDMAPVIKKTKKVHVWVVSYS